MARATPQAFVGILTFKASDSGEQLGETEFCTSKKDALVHAEHLAATYGVEVSIYKGPTYLATVSER